MTAVATRAEDHSKKFEELYAVSSPASGSVLCIKFDSVNDFHSCT